jgi:hypothetical protein
MVVNCARGNEFDASQLPTKASRWQKTIFPLVLIFLLSAALAATLTPTAWASPSASVPPSATGTPRVIVFSPSAVMLNNPANPGAPATPTTFTVNLTAYDSNGNVLTPTSDNPLHVHVYGAPDGVISPVDTELTSGTAVQFTYSGGFFPNNLELAAWIKNPTGGAALGTTLFVQQNRPACTGSSDFDLAMVTNVPDEIKVKAVVGADNPQGHFSHFTLDTGSLGVIVTKGSLIMGANVHGPGAEGQKYYDSSGYIFTGNYYLAPVSLQLKDGTYVQSNPILVLAIDGAHCDASHKNCKAPKPDLHYLGIGFNRNSTGTGDLFDSPSENASLQLTDASNGTDINQGYILSKDGVTMGITAAKSSGFNMITLDPNPVAGDWLPEPGCYQFTTLEGRPQFCGNLLLDVGIAEMFIDLSFDQRPAGSYDSNNEVPSGVGMNILAGSTNNPAMSYNFTAVQPPTQPTGPAPTFVRWDDTAKIFVNTGRRPLLNFDYLYSGQCGEVGFRPVKN